MPDFPHTFLFMRHAHSVSQEDPTIVVGRAAECPLSAKGRVQAQHAANALRTLGITRLYASTCVRALETADYAGHQLALPVIPDERLIERSHGELEGRKKEEAYTPQVITQIHADQLHWRPAGGESLDDVKNRLRNFLEAVIASPQGGSCLIVTHLMVMWALFHLCTQCNHAILPALRVDNAGLVEVERTDVDTFRLIRWNRPLWSQG